MNFLFALSCKGMRTRALRCHYYNFFVAPALVVPARPTRGGGFCFIHLVGDVQIMSAHGPLLNRVSEPRSQRTGRRREREEAQGAPGGSVWGGPWVVGRRAMVTEVPMTPSTSAATPLCARREANTLVLGPALSRPLLSLSPRFLSREFKKMCVSGFFSLKQL